MLPPLRLFSWSPAFPASQEVRGWVSRSWVGLAVLCLAMVPRLVQAGAQAEEPLADSVRTALSAAIGRSAPALSFADARQRQQCETWAGSLESKLLKRKPDDLVRKEFLVTVCYEAKRAGLEPSLVLGLIQVESGFRKYAISSVGARGYMQVMPFWSRLIGTGDPASLFHMQTNLRFGCVILRHYLDREKGNLFMALGRYNGSRGRAEYPNMVTAAWRTWKSADDVLGTTRMAGAENNGAGVRLVSESPQR